VGVQCDKNVLCTMHYAFCDCVLLCAVVLLLLVVWCIFMTCVCMLCARLRVHFACACAQFVSAVFAHVCVRAFNSQQTLITPSSFHKKAGGTFCGKMRPFIPMLRALIPAFLRTFCRNDKMCVRGCGYEKVCAENELLFQWKKQTSNNLVGKAPGITERSNPGTSREDTTVLRV
jgi:hypothetical protein